MLPHLCRAGARRQAACHIGRRQRCCVALASCEVTAWRVSGDARGRRAGCVAAGLTSTCPYCFLCTQVVWRLARRGYAAHGLCLPAWIAAPLPAMLVRESTSSRELCGVSCTAESSREGPGCSALLCSVSCSSCWCAFSLAAARPAGLLLGCWQRLPCLSSTVGHLQRAGSWRMQPCAVEAHASSRFRAAAPVCSSALQHLPLPFLFLLLSECTSRDYS